ncbi:MAG: hypothetical protein OK441_04215 [Thaumarchaeota archaeon]|nr:hypothetical protein [Nitrososphaerota archaeon]
MTAQASPIDSSVRKWDEMLAYLESGGDRTYGFLQLAQSDLQAYASEISCPYCRKQIMTELRLLVIALNFSRLANEWEASSGLRTRLGLIGRAVPLIARLSFLEFTKIL